MYLVTFCVFSSVLEVGESSKEVNFSKNERTLFVCSRIHWLPGFTVTYIHTPVTRNLWFVSMNVYMSLSLSQGVNTGWSWLDEQFSRISPVCSRQAHASCEMLIFIFGGCVALKPRKCIVDCNIDQIDLKKRFTLNLYRHCTMNVDMLVNTNVFLFNLLNVSFIL